jgi:hypothetical protein
MKKILMVENGTPKVMEETAFTIEQLLQKNLLEYPELIPLEEVEDNPAPLLPIGWEVTIPAGSIDLLLTDDLGLLTIVETKLAKNPEVRREVVGQILDYAACVSEWDMGRVEKEATTLFNSHLSPPELKGKDIFAAMRILREKTNRLEEWDESAYRNALEKNLKEGSIRLIVAVDSINEQLRRVVTFVNSYSSFDLLLLQVSCFEDPSDRRIFVPTLYGYAKKMVAPGRKTIWDKEKFLNQVREKCVEQEAKVIKSLFEFFESSENWVVSFGTGFSVGSFNPKPNWGGPSILTVYSTGTISINFPGIIRHGDEEIADRFRQMLNESLAMKIPEAKLAAYPSIKAEIVTKEDKLDVFKKILHELLAEIENKSDNLKSKGKK